jgi:UDP-glucose 4-epimerase
VRLIAGASGVLGSGFCEFLIAQGEAFTRMELPWDEPALVAERVVAYWRAAEAADPCAPITLVWAAGTGTVAAPEPAMVAETEVLRAVVAALGERVQPNLANCFLFSSSAGALYGGHGGGLIGPATPPAPITSYGREKLVQEGIVAGLQQAGVMRAVSCRFTNIYGLAGGRLRRKGLVSVLVHSALLRQPARLFVSPDTRRDYLYNVDAARLSLAEADAATAGAAGAATVTIVRAGSTTTILDLVATTSRVLRRRVPVVITESPESRVQPLVLRFQERSGIQAVIPTTSLEAAIRSMAEAPRG